MPSGLWRNRDYRVWFAGDTFSQIGLFVGAFAFTLLAYEATDDAAVAGLIGSANALAQALSILPGGLLLDRLDRRTLMIGSGLAAFLLYGLLAFLCATGVLEVGPLLAFAVASGAVGGLFANVTDVVLPRVVGARSLPDASAANQSRDAAIQLGAAPLSGLLFGLHPALPFAVGSLARLGETFSAVALRTDLRPGPTGDARHGDVSEDAGSGSARITAGLRWLAAWPQPRTLIVLVVCVNFALASCGTSIVISQQQIGPDPWKIGAIQTFQGVGVLLGAFTLIAIARRLTGGVIIQISLCIIGLAFFGAVFTQNVWLIAPLAMIASLPLIPLNAMQGAYLALLIPDGLRGRVLSIQTFLASIASALAPAVSGLLLRHAGYVVAIAVPVALLSLVVVMAFVSKSVSRVPRQRDFDGITPLPYRV